MVKYLLILFLSLPAMADSFIPEASGICRVGKNIVIAGDEEKNVLWLNSVKTKVQNGKWDDLEALTPVSSHTFFGVTSLGMTKKAERKEGREKIMLFSIQDEKIEVKKEWNLRTEVLHYLATVANDSIDMNAALRAPPKEGGLNIEGAAYLSGKIYLGLRSPLTRSGKTIIVEVDVKDKLIVSGWRTIDLKGNGIRDLSVEGSSLLILAGSSDDSDKHFDLFSLKGNSLSLLSVPGFSSLLRPEGVLKDADGSFILVQDFVGPQAQEFLVRLQP